MEKRYAKMLTVKEVSELLRIEEPATRRLLRRENLGFKLGRKVLVPEEDLTEWIDKRNRKLRGQR